MPKEPSAFYNMTRNTGAFTCLANSCVSKPRPQCRDFAFKSRHSFGGEIGCLRHKHHTARLKRYNVPVIRAEGAIKAGELVSSEEEFLKKVTHHQGPIIVDWMAKWCRKCIYLKPKLEKMLNAEFPGLDLVFIDVNSIPGNLVYGHGIKIHKDGTKVREHIAAEAAPKAIANIRSMVQDYIDLNPEEKKMALKK